MTTLPPSQHVGRDTVLDMVRTLCILEIVAFWHLLNYVNPKYLTSTLSSYGNSLTICVLSSFTFLSGYFLKKYSISTLLDVKVFYLKRIKRFWVPFFLASLSLHIASIIVHSPWYVDNWHFIASLLGLSVFLNPAPSTMWYMGMLTFFYLITPIVLSIKNQRLRILVSSLIVLLVVYCVERFHLDRRTAYYLPMFLLGLLLPSDFVTYVKSNRCLALVLSFIVIFIAITVISPALLRTIALLIVGPVFTISLSSIIAESRLLTQISSVVSYASMNMYLFHRHFYLLAVYLFNFKAAKSISDMTMPIWLLLMIVLPIIVLSSYWFQRLYDNIVYRFEHKRSQCR